MYDPELSTRNAALRTSSFMKTRDSGIFLIFLCRNRSQSQDLQMRSCREAVSLNYANGVEPRPSINWPRPSLLDRIDESRQFGAKGFFRWKLQLVHRAFLRFYFFAIGHMLIRKRPYLVLCHIVIAHRRRTRPHNGDFAEFAGRMVTGLDRREYRGTVALVIFQNNQRFVIHSAAEKIT